MNITKDDKKSYQAIIDNDWEIIFQKSTGFDTTPIEDLKTK